MSLDIMEIGAKLEKECMMDKVQSEKEVEYRVWLKLLKILHRRSIVTDVGYALIDELNRQTFSPALSKVYV